MKRCWEGITHVLCRAEGAAARGPSCKLGFIPQGNTQNLFPFPLDVVDNSSPTIRKQRNVELVTFVTKMRVSSNEQACFVVSQQCRQYIFP